ncbi:MAG: hypothetical protein ACOCUI_05240 [bacterium]
MSDIPEPNVETLPTADITISEQKDGVYQTEIYQIKKIMQNENDFMVTLKSSIIVKIYSKLKKMERIKIQWDEIALVIFSASSSASITAALSKPNDIQDWLPLFYTIFPIIASVSIVFAVMYKIFFKKEKQNYIEQLIEEIEPIKEEIDKMRSNK